MAAAVVSRRRRPSWVRRQKPASDDSWFHQARAARWCGWSATASANHTFTSGKECFVIGDGPDPAPGGGYQRQAHAVTGVGQLLLDQPFNGAGDALAGGAGAAGGGVVEPAVRRGGEGR